MYMHIKSVPFIKNHSQNLFAFLTVVLIFYRELKKITMTMYKLSLAGKKISSIIISLLYATFVLTLLLHFFKVI
jgi:hypothetical protein